MLKESKPQSKSPTPSFHQHFKTPSNKYDNQAPRYHSRSNGNHYRRFSRESAYKVCCHPPTIVAKDIILTTLLRTIPHVIVVIELVMI